MVRDHFEHMTTKGRFPTGHWGTVLGVLVFAFLFTGPAYALGPDMTDVVDNVEASVSDLPGLIAALAYMMGLLMGVLGILKLREHVENPRQQPLGPAMVRLLAGGALFALPMVAEAMLTTLDPNWKATAGPEGDMGAVGSVLADISSYISGGLNGVMRSILTSLQTMPGLISGIGYLLALVLMVSGILKVRDHVDNPMQTTIKEPVVRFLTGGALFALPMFLSAMQNTIQGTDSASFGGLIDTVLGGFFTSGLGAAGPGDCFSPSNLLNGLIGSIPFVGGWLSGALGLGGGGGATLGTVACNVFKGTMFLPFFLNGMAYLFGIVLGVWGLMKIKDHVLAPQQVTIWEGVSRLAAGGAFFALPYIVNVIQSTMTPTMTFWGTSGFNGAASGGGLDAMMMALMSNLYTPMMFLINFTGYAVGIILIMIGISRLLKGANEGPRAPGGLGTMMTFATGGALLSFMPMIATATTTMFGSATVATTAALQYTDGMDGDMVEHAHGVISAILMFMIMLGAISVFRGIYIIRSVAEGNGQASMMAGITHILGGAMAINLGPLMNAVQTTLGLDAYGVNFS